RPPLLRQNHANYVPVGLAPHRRSFTSNPVQTPLDLQSWLVHLAGPGADTFEGLLGDPVVTSQGDLWHRRAARLEAKAVSYLKIPFGREEPTAELDRLLEVCELLDVRGLSVTAPLKYEILNAGRVSIADDTELCAANTLRLSRAHPGQWEAIDTDEAGMKATLAEAEKRGVEPGSVAIIGRGGVSSAVLRAIEDSSWQLAHQASGRAGWTKDAPERVTMVINAVGDSDNAYIGPPACEAWVDLHYSGVRPPPAGIKVHLNGDTFFDAQARAQRDFWRTTTPQDGYA
ncbi:MAG: hypothetical protein ACNA8W_25855, partial [Bradymonadaceae bacterium]